MYKAFPFTFFHAQGLGDKKEKKDRRNILFSLSNRIIENKMVQGIIERNFSDFSDLKLIFLMCFTFPQKSTFKWGKRQKRRIKMWIKPKSERIC